ncbi:MAG: hypothetical protein WDA07_06195 [Leucobacter sp.]
MNENEAMKIGVVDRFSFYESPAPQVDVLHRRTDVEWMRMVREIAAASRIRQGGVEGLRQLFPTLGTGTAKTKRRKRGGKGRR